MKVIYYENNIKKTINASSVEFLLSDLDWRESLFIINTYSEGVIEIGIDDMVEICEERKED